MFTKLLSQIANFFRSLFQSEKKTQQNVQEAPDVDEIASNFYEDLLDADRKRKT